MTRTILLAALFVPGVALAQVSVNPGALDRLQPSAPASHSAPPAHAGRPAPHRPVHHAAPVHKAPVAHVAPATSHASKLRPGQPPAVPAAPPPGVTLPPPVTGPPRPVVTPTVPVTPAAQGNATPIDGGIRITFGVGSADMNADTEAAIRSFAQSVKANPGADLNVYAYAGGVPDDPSTPRRLSLSRALAVRAVLITEGIVSTRIYPRALGASPSQSGLGGAPDRVDLMLANTPTTPPATH